MNLEMAATEEMVAIACRIKPPHCCLVPEKREELTTEGGLDVVGNQAWIAQCCQRLGQAGIDVSLFIDADPAQIRAARECGAPTIEIHTGHYADATDPASEQQELAKIRDGVAYALEQGLVVNAGHGLHYHNTLPIAAIPGINELNIGHSIIARAVMSGLDDAVRTMRDLLDGVNR
jgi:pyridoxine 5-phosphate synthase